MWSLLPIEKSWIFVLLLTFICGASCYLIDYQSPYPNGVRSYPQNPTINSYTGNRLPGDYVKNLIAQNTGNNIWTPTISKSQIDKSIATKMEPLNRYPEIKKSSRGSNYQYYDFGNKRYDSPAVSVIQSIRPVSYTHLDVYKRQVFYNF